MGDDTTLETTVAAATDMHEGRNSTALDLVRYFVAFDGSCLIRFRVRGKRFHGDVVETELVL
jgi:hypothetical protein